MISADRFPAVWFPAVRTGSGTDIFTEELATALARRGIRVGITWLPLRAEYAPWSVPVPKAPPWANMVHVNSWLHPRFLPARLPVVSTLHFCVHDPALRAYKGPGRRLYHSVWIRHAESRNLRRADRVVAVSHYTAKAAREAFGLEEIEVIHNGVDIHRFCPTERALPNRPFRLLYVGNWSLRKGVDLLSPIMQKLGEGFELAYTADRRGAHSRYLLPSNCRCLGRLSGNALVAAYQEADALLFPSRMEGLPLTMIEAMACGLPVIASACTSHPEVVDDGVQGRLCSGSSADVYVAACRSLRENPDMWSRMRKMARQRAEERFALSAQVDSYLELYSSLVGR